MTRSAAGVSSDRARGRGLKLLIAAGMLVGVAPLAVSASAAADGYSVSLVPAPGPVPVAVAVDQATDRVYLASLSSDQVTVVNGATNAIAATVALTGNPLGVTPDATTNVIYVTERTPSGVDVAVIDGATATVTATIPATSGQTSIGIAVDSSTDTVYVANEDEADLTVIDGATNTVVGTISTGSNTMPYQVTVDEPAGVVWVSTLADGTAGGRVIAIDAASHAVLASIPVSKGSVYGIAVDAATDTIYAADGGGHDVAVIDGTTDALVATVPVPISLGPLGVAVDTQAGTIYATSSSAEFGTTWTINAATNTITDTLGRGGIAVAADQVTGAAYEAPYSTPGLWVVTPAASNAWSPVITTTSLPNWNTGSPGSQTVAANAFPAASFSESGALPPGLKFSPDGTVSGTPAAGSGGNYPITVTASNGTPPDFTRPIDLVVDQPPVVTAPSGVTFRVGTTSSVPLQATGYPAPVLGIVYGPPGLAVRGSADTGWQLVGSPPPGSGGTYDLELSASGAGITYRHIAVTIDEAPAITSKPAATFRTGVRGGSFFVDATGYPAPAFTETGKLPYGISLTPRGALIGTPGLACWRRVPPHDHR